MVTHTILTVLEDAVCFLAARVYGMKLSDGILQRQAIGRHKVMQYFHQKNGYRPIKYVLIDSLH
jgi:hypothetical protein